MIFCQKCILARKLPKDTVSRPSPFGIGSGKRSFRQLGSERVTVSRKISWKRSRIREERFQRQSKEGRCYMNASKLALCISVTALIVAVASAMKSRQKVNLSGLRSSLRESLKPPSHQSQLSLKSLEAVGPLLSKAEQMPQQN